jgi:hypothetical protein
MTEELPDPWGRTRRLDIETRGDLVKRTLFIPKLVKDSTGKYVSHSDAQQDAIGDDEEITDTDNNATCFRQFAEYWLARSFDNFLEENPYHFLIQETLLNKTASSGYFTTTDSDSRDAKSVDLFAAVLYRLRKKSRGSFPHMITVGRANNNDVFIKDNLISKFHAYFMVRGNQWYLADIGSTNGTFVNNVPLEANAPQPIELFALLSFSDNLTYRFIDNERILGYLRFYMAQQALEQSGATDSGSNPVQSTPN